MIKYSIKIHLNKEIKTKVNYYFPLEFTEGEKQGHVTKLLGQFWVSSHHSHTQRSIHTRCYQNLFYLHIQLCLELSLSLLLILPNYYTEHVYY